MRAAASAFPLLCIASLLPAYFGFDAEIFGRVVFVDRVAHVSALGLYAAWLVHWSRAPDWCAALLAGLVGLSLCAIFLPRLWAMPIIWGLQLAILAALALWLVAVRRDRWAALFVGVATAAHAVGALTIFPLCQLGAPADLMALPNAAYVCTVVIGEVWAALLPAGIGAAAWAALVTAAIARGRA
jgi:hypothetical protein